ncbi:MAG: IS200/IS605 family transposase [Pseudomonadota bacterium]
MTNTILSYYLQPLKESYWEKSLNSVYKAYYHLILFTPKYRSMINHEMSEDLESILKDISTTKGYELFGLSIHPNHTHLILGAKPTHFIPDIVKDIRERTSFLIMGKYKDIQKQHKVKKLWSRNFGVETLGNFNIEKIEDCLRDTKEHHLLDEWEKHIKVGKK